MVSEIKIGDIMIVKPGEKIHTDGIVLKGESSVDESMVTGESMPVDKIKDSSVIGATLNQDGILYVKAVKVGKDTLLFQIIKMVREAQSSKASIQDVAEQFVLRTSCKIVFYVFLLWNLYFLHRNGHQQ